MKKLFTSALLFASLAFNCQSVVKPVFGVRYTGGLEYKADHEYPSLELGILVKPEKKYLLVDSYYTSLEILNDYSTFYSKQETGTERDLEVHNSKFGAIIRLTNLTKIDGDFALSTTFGVGGTIEKSPAPIFTYGIGVHTLNLPFNFGFNFERIMSSNYLSLNCYFNLSK